jgi:Bifunctional DNA primase/polymerase, N-terminal
MTNATLRQALAYAERGWPVFPCLPSQKIPATQHGYLDATTDQQRVTEWFGRQGGWNLAIATGNPGPDVLDVDQHGPAGNGFTAFARLRAAGLLQGASSYVRTPSGGLHAYFTGSAQRNGHLPAHHLDFRSAGGYVLAPPSQVSSRPYERIRTLDGHGGLDWQAVIRLLEPDREYQQPATRPLPDHGITRLVRWVAAQREGNRNAGLFWAANRALEADPAADLNELAAAARQAGLPEPEITRTLNSARRTHQAIPKDPGRQSEGAS